MLLMIYARQSSAGHFTKTGAEEKGGCWAALFKLAGPRLALNPDPEKWEPVFGKKSWSDKR
ncbi:MAG: hypothetical protein E5X58_08910 [Mesorhizobium sp.]|nr:MAG: hypothetical protein E5X58_08910 [Mesorhizobium sp.]